MTGPFRVAAMPRLIGLKCGTLSPLAQKRPGALVASILSRLAMIHKIICTVKDVGSNNFATFIIDYTPVLSTPGDELKCTWTVIIFLKGSETLLI